MNFICPVLIRSILKSLWKIFHYFKNINYSLYLIKNDADQYKSIYCLGNSVAHIDIVNFFHVKLLVQVLIPFKRSLRVYQRLGISPAPETIILQLFEGIFNT